MGRRKTLAEKHELKLAKKDYKLSLKTDNHQNGRQELLKAMLDGLAHCNFGELVMYNKNTLFFNSNKRLTS